MRVGAQLIQSLGLLFALLFVPTAYAGELTSLDSFLDIRRAQLTQLLPTVITDSVPKATLQEFQRSALDEWRFVDTFNAPRISENERAFWCGLHVISAQLEGVYQEADRRTMAKASLNALNGSAPMPAKYKCERWEHQVVDVSLIELIARPDDFRNEFVRVEGVLRIEFEGNALYLTKEHYEHDISRNAVWLDIDPSYRDGSAHVLERKNGTYVAVEGRFDSKCHGHMGAFSGCITKIERL
jgi:hypothetical protein